MGSMPLRLLSLLTLLFALPSFAADADGNWQKLDEDDGVTVWKNEVPGQELPGFRGEVLIGASIDAIVKVLEDNAHHTEWMYKCVESKVLKRTGEGESIVYNRTSAPWPVWDRDVILATKLRYNADKTELTLDFHQVASDLRKLPEKTVRMPRLTGFYKMWRVSDKQTRVRYQVEADVGGSLPRWLAERVSKDLPFQTLSRLRARLEGKG
jgi:hypothetical protein